MLLMIKTTKPLKTKGPSFEFKPNVRGFSLLELLLVLFVIAGVMLITQTQLSRKQSEQAAQQLGTRLAEYGAAVVDYAQQNPEKLPPGSPIERWGYEWLQTQVNPASCRTVGDTTDCQPFLPTDFSLQAAPLGLQPLEEAQEGGHVLRTRFNWAQNEGSNEAPHLIVDQIQVGPVTESGTVSGPAIAAVIHIANQTLVHSQPAPIQYHADPINNANSPIIGYSKKIIFAPQNEHLLISGQNKMRGEIRFLTSGLAENREIRGVNRVEFAAPSWEPGNPGSVNSYGSLQGVDTLSLSAYYANGQPETNPPLLQHLQASPPCTLNSTTQTQVWLTAKNIRSGTQVNFREISFCMLTAIQRAGSHCEISIQPYSIGFSGTDTGHMYVASIAPNQNNRTCQVTCFTWAPQPSGAPGYCTKAP